MKTESILNDLATIRSHIFHDPESAVRVWSSVECDDYQLPLILVNGFFSGALLGYGPLELSIKDTVTYLAAYDILRNSHLREIIVDSEHTIRLNFDVDPEVLAAVRQDIKDNFAGIA